MSEAVRGLVVAHASVAAGLVDAVARIAGPEADALRALSNEGCGPEHLRERLGELLGEGPAVVFTDLGSGSCAFAARHIALQRPRTAVITGVNLPILLDFVFNRTLPLAELVPRLVEKGRAGVTGTCRDGTNADQPAAR